MVCGNENPLSCFQALTPEQLEYEEQTLENLREKSLSNFTNAIVDIIKKSGILDMPLFLSVVAINRLLSFLPKNNPLRGSLEEKREKLFLEYRYKALKYHNDLSSSLPLQGNDAKCVRINCPNRGLHRPYNNINVFLCDEHKNLEILFNSRHALITKYEYQENITRYSMSRFTLILCADLSLNGGKNHDRVLATFFYSLNEHFGSLKALETIEQCFEKLSGSFACFQTNKDSLMQIFNSEIQAQKKLDRSYVQPRLAVLSFPKSPIQESILFPPKDEYPCIEMEDEYRCIEMEDTQDTLPDCEEYNIIVLVY